MLLVRRNYSWSDSNETPSPSKQDDHPFSKSGDGMGDGLRQWWFWKELLYGAISISRIVNNLARCILQRVYSRHGERTLYCHGRRANVAVPTNVQHAFHTVGSFGEVSSKPTPQRTRTMAPLRSVTPVIGKSFSEGIDFWKTYAPY